MSVYQHLVIHVPPRTVDAVAERIVNEGAPRVAAAGGRLFGVWKSELGLSRDHGVALVEWPDEETATTHAIELLHGIDPIEVERDEIWEPTLRPEAGATIEPTSGVFSHRWFDVEDSDIDRFLELSGQSWSDWEAGATNYVVGLWRSHSRPAAGLTRFWLMAWYENLATWEGTRYWNRDTSALESGYSQLDERNEIIVDRAVSILWRLG